jgi:hypothetical protein
MGFVDSLDATYKASRLYNYPNFQWLANIGININNKDSFSFVSI